MYLGGLIRKEFGRIRSDKRTLILLFVIPVILIFVFGLTTGGGLTKFFTSAIITLDDMPTYDNFPSNSSEYDDTFISIMQYNTSSWGFHSYYNATDLEEYDKAFNYYYDILRSGDIDIIIILPSNFSESVENKTNPVLIYHIDASDPAHLVN